MDVTTLIITACGSAFTGGVFGIIMWALNRRDKKKDKTAALTEQVTALTHQVERLTEEVDGLTKQMKDNSDGVRATLHDRIRYLGQLYIRAKEIDLDDRANLVQMHEVYHTLGGNGNLDALMHQIERLPLREDMVYSMEEKEWH